MFFFSYPGFLIALKFLMKKNDRRTDVIFIPTQSRPTEKQSYRMTVHHAHMLTLPFAVFVGDVSPCES